MTRPWWVPVLWVMLGAALLATAYLLINTTFMLYDDEGYVLITYQKFIAGERLYQDVFSQYGPWPYLYHLLVSRILHSPVTHMLGRNLTAVHWVLGAVFCGFITHQLTRNRLAAIFTTLVTFALLWQMTSEPAHPGGLIALMLAATTFATIRLYQKSSWTLLGVTLGLASALLLLTKINIGLFFIAGAGCAVLRLTAWSPRVRKASSRLAAAGLLLVPWGLMGPRLGEPWVLIFALQFTMAAAGLLWLASSRSPATADLPTKTWRGSAGVFLTTIAGIIIIMAARGTSPASIWRAVFIEPMQHPASFMVGLRWPQMIWLVSVVGVLLVIRAGWELRTHGRISGPTRLVVIVVRLGVLLVFVWQAAMWPTLQGVSTFLIYSLPLLPIFLIPLEQKKDGNRAILFWLASLALPQILHAYPVAGSQMGWGSFLLVPLFVAGLHEAWLALGGHFPRAPRQLPVVAWTLTLLVGVAQLGLLAQTGWQRYHDAKPINLPGAGDIRPGDTARLTLRMMTMNAQIHSDVLFSYPGMYSYNLWSGVPTPTNQNATHWFWLLNDSAQEQIIKVLNATPRSAVICNFGFDDYFKQNHVPSHGPLRELLDTAYRPLFRYGYFQFLVPNSSQAVPFGLAELLVPAADETPADYPALLRTNIVLNGRLSALQLQDINTPWTVREAYSPPEAKILLQPITSQGRTLGPAVELSLMQEVHGLYRVEIYTRRQPDLSRPDSLVLVGLDAAGAVLSESVIQ